MSQKTFADIVVKLPSRPPFSFSFAPSPWPSSHREEETKSPVGREDKVLKRGERTKSLPQAVETKRSPTERRQKAPSGRKDKKLWGGSGENRDEEEGCGALSLRVWDQTTRWLALWGYWRSFGPLRLKQPAPFLFVARDACGRFWTSWRRASYTPHGGCPLGGGQRAVFWVTGRPEGGWERM